MNLIFQISYDWQNAGYSTADDSDLAFYANECEVRNTANKLQFIKFVRNNCLNSDTLFLNSKSSLDVAPYFTTNEFRLSFDAFAFSTNSSLLFSCSIEICPANDCTQAANKTCV